MRSILLVLALALVGCVVWDWGGPRGPVLPQYPDTALDGSEHQHRATRAPPRDAGSDAGQR